jgi:phage terminase Nu1 subunit (DNA packaging protein)
LSRRGVGGGGKPQSITAKQLADAIGVDRRTIAKWQDDGMPVAVRGRGGRPSQYDLDACRAWKDARDQVATDLDGQIDLLRERARKDRAQALLAEQLYAVRAGKLLDAEAVTRAWSREYAAIKAILIASYTSAADRIYRAATLEGLIGVERELKAVAFAALREISNPDRGTDVPRKRRAARRANAR